MVVPSDDVIGSLVRLELRCEMYRKYVTPTTHFHSAARFRFILAILRMIH